jgi:hypothetical protein
VGPTVILQVEFLAGILCFYGMYLMLSARRSVRFMGEITLVVVTSLKGTTIFFSLLCFFLVLHIQNKSLFASPLRAGRFFVLNTFAIVLMFAELQDRAALQGTDSLSDLALDIPKLFEVLYGTQRAIIYMPALLLLPFLLIRILVKDRRGDLQFILVGLIGVFFFTMYSQIPFPYHFFFLTFLTSCLLLISLSSKTRFKKFEGGLLFGFLAVLTLVLIKFWSPINIVPSFASSFEGEGKIIQKAFFELNNEMRAMEEAVVLLDNSSVLFLADGRVNFFLPNKSFCDQYYPVHFQRAAKLDFSTNLVNSDYYREFIKCTDSYQGKFIVVDSNWIGEEHISSFISSNYSQIYSFRFGYGDLVLYELNSGSVE